ncbi:MAG TPA: DUF397 domain-containing protein [Actinophytocola sp.]|jgi:hypothetical protein|uniref:DUF397 domain-containing protein n=1 Tax=Actinophytocola sp. TaxID=1872138 RepID=UPI002DFFD24F|nr:DUF397 domain-containing protein [Actinophytocola sp.]
MSAHTFPEATWRKSTHSSGNAECVEVARLPSRVGVRDSKHYAVGPVLRFPCRDWSTFTKQLT